MSDRIGYCNKCELRSTKLDCLSYNGLLSENAYWINWHKAKAQVTEILTKR